MTALLADSDTLPGVPPEPPTGRRRRRRWLRTAGTLTLVAGSVLALLYAPPVQRWAFRRATAFVAARTSHVVTARDVAINPLALRIELEGLAIASAATPQHPYLTAARVSADALRGVLRGQPGFSEIRARDVAIDMAKVAPGPAAGGGFRGLGQLRADRITIDNLSYHQGDAASTRITVTRVSLRGRGTGPGRLSLATTAPASLVYELGDARLPFDAVSAAFRIEGDHLVIDRLGAESETARADVSGTARFERGYPVELDYEADIDLARAAGWWQTSSTTRGRAHLRGHVTGPLSTLTSVAHAESDNFAWSTLSPGRLVLDGSILPTGLDVRAFRLDVREVSARGRGFLTWSHAVPRSSMQVTWQAHRLRQLGPLVELEPATIPLVQAVGTAAVSWPAFVPDLGGLAGTLATRLKSDAPTGDDAGTVVMTGAASRWAVDWHQALPGQTTAHGRLDVRVHANRFADSVVTGQLVASVGDAAPAIRRAAALDVSVPKTALERLEAGRVSLSGPVSGTVSMPVWHAEMAADAVVMSGLRDISASGSFVVDPDWFRTQQLKVRAPGSTIDLRGTVGVLKDDSDVTFEGTVDASWASAPFVPAAWPVAGATTLSGTWTTRKGVDDLDVTFDLLGPTLAGRPVGPITGHVLSGITVTSGEVAVPKLGLRASGRADVDHPLATRASVQLERADVATWLALAGARETAVSGVKVLLDGSIDAVGGFEHPETTDVVVNVSRVDGTVNDKPTRLSAPARAEWSQGRLDLPDSTLTVGPLSLVASHPPDSRDISRVTLASTLADAISVLPAGVVPADIVADGSARVEAIVPRSNPREFRVEAEAVVTRIQQGAVELVRDFRARAVGSRERVDLDSAAGTVLGATVDSSASAPSGWFTAQRGTRAATARGTVSGPVGRILAAAGMATEELDGDTAVTFDLSALAPSVDAVRGSIDVGRLGLRTRSGSFELDAPARVRLEHSYARIEHFALQGGGTRFEASGRVGLWPSGPVDVRLVGAGSMALVDAFVAPRVEGDADVALRVTGTVGHPDFDGSLTLRGVSAVSSRARLVLADVNGRVLFRPGRIESIDLRGQVNGGTVVVSGAMPLAGGGDESIRLAAADVFVEYPRGLKHRVSADLSLSGGLGTPELRGTTVFQTDPYRESLPKMAQILVALGQPVSSGQAVAAAAGLVDRLAIDVGVTSAVPLVLDNSLGRLEFIPRLRIVGTAGQPGLSGPVQIVDGGRIFLQSRTYTLSDSRMVFYPEDGFVPQLQMSGSTRVSTYDVTLRISGPADAVELGLSSDPPLPERELQGLLLTGQSADGSIRSAGSDAFAITALSSDLLGIAGRTIGLDSVRIGAESFELVSSDVTPTTRLTVAKSLLDRFELVYSDNLDNNRSTWILVYRPKAGIELRGASRDNLTKAIEFRHQIAFGRGGPRRNELASGDLPRSERPREVVEAVTITGEGAATTAALRNRLRLTSGKVFDYGLWTRDARVLRRYFLESGYLAARVLPLRSVRPSGRGSDVRVALEYRVTRGPRTVVVVTGVQPSDRFLGVLRNAWAETSFDQLAASDMARAGRGFLLDEGFVVPDVSVAVETLGDGSLQANVSVVPGLRPRRRAVTFDGMTVFSELDVIAIALSATSVEGAWRDPSVVTAAVSNAYAAAGYRNTRVEALPVSIQGEKAELPFYITEGSATVVGAVRLSGVAQARESGVREAAALGTGRLLRLGEERAARLRVERYYRNLGYRNATASMSVAPLDADGRADIDVVVSEGRLQVVRAVAVEGARTTKRSLVDDAVQMQVGKPASQALVAETQRRLYALGVFNSAEVRLVPAARTATDSADDVLPVNAVVSLVEPKRFQFVYGLEAANEYGPVFDDFQNAVGLAGDVRDRNVFGRGMSASMGGRYEAGLRTVRGLFSIPRLGSSSVRTNVFTSWRSEESDSDAGDTSETVSWKTSVEQRWRPVSRVDVSWGYSLVDRRVTLVSARGSSSLASDGLLSSANAAIVVDTRDAVMDARKGWFHSSSWQQGLRTLGSDYGYTRYLGRTFLFASAGRVTSASAVRFGSLWRVSGVAPIDVADLLFRAGGGQTIRGYAQDQLSADRVAGFSIGGTRLLVANEELRVSLGRWFQGVGFLDVGNAFGSGGLVWRDLAVGTGFGLRVMTPLAPLRLDVGFPVPRGTANPLWRIHISVGQMF
jgi:outer membrane protein insertion porin family